MNKLILLSLLLFAINSWPIFANTSILNPSQALLPTSNNYSTISNRLPYTLRKVEINSLPKCHEKEEAQELYSFMKLSFSIINNNKEELNKLFISPHADIILIQFCKNILQKQDNYKYLGENYNQYYDSTIKVLNSNKREYKQYIKDIIRNNIYSVNFNTLIEWDKLDANCYQYITKSYIRNTFIPQIYNEIQDKYRSLLNNYLLYKTYRNISSKNYESYLFNMNGIHRDIYDNKRNYIIFSELNFETFIWMINNLNNYNKEFLLQNIKYLTIE